MNESIDVSADILGVAQSYKEISLRPFWFRWKFQKGRSFFMNQINNFSQAGVSEGAKPSDAPAFLFYLD